MGVWYRSGTVSVTNGNPAVVGVGTLWTTQASVGDIFLGPNLAEHEITAITDDTHMSVMQVNGTAAYAGTTASAQVYAIIRNFTSTLPAQLASQLAAMMTAWHVTTDELTAWLSGSGSTTVHDSVGNAYSVQTPAALNAAWNGRLVKNIAGGTDVIFTSAEASNLFIELQGTLTANIANIMPAGVRHNFIFNNTAGAFVPTVKTAAGTGITVAQGKRALLECDGTNVVQALTSLAITGGSIDGASIGTTTPSTGAFTTLSATGGISGTTGAFSSTLTPAVDIQFGAGGTAFTSNQILRHTNNVLYIQGGTGGMQLNRDSSRGDSIDIGSTATQIGISTGSAVRALISNAGLAVTGSITASNGLTSTAGTTNLGTTTVGALYTAGTIQLASASVGAGAQAWIGGNSSSTSWFINAPTGGTTTLGVNNVAIATVSAAGMAVTGLVVTGGTSTTITSDITAATYNQVVADSDMYVNYAGTCTLTLLNPATYPGRYLRIRNYQAQLVNSASANINLNGTVSSSIIAATIGKWVLLKSDGVIWEVLNNN